MLERFGVRKRRLALAVDSRKCINCKACMVACKAENEVPLGCSRNRINEDSGGAYPRLRASFEPEQCHHCASPSCVRVCPTGASYQREDGLVLVNADDCIGCGYCIIACPYDARFFNEETRVVDKCTMCAHRVDAGRPPACVETCPTKVRTLGDLADPDSAIRKLLDSRRSQVKQPQTGNGPHIHYLV
jgi:tetrathionate reductase subunit B